MTCLNQTSRIPSLVSFACGVLLFSTPKCHCAHGAHGSCLASSEKSMKVLSEAPCLFEAATIYMPTLVLGRLQCLMSGLHNDSPLISSKDCLLGGEPCGTGLWPARRCGRVANDEHDTAMCEPFRKRSKNNVTIPSGLGEHDAAMCELIQEESGKHKN